MTCTEDNWQEALKAAGIEAKWLDLGDAYEAPPFRVTPVPARHGGGVQIHYINKHGFFKQRVPWADLPQHFCLMFQAAALFEVTHEP